MFARDQFYKLIKFKQINTLGKILGFFISKMKLVNSVQITNPINNQMLGNEIQTYKKQFSKPIRTKNWIFVMKDFELWTLLDVFVLIPKKY